MHEAGYQELELEFRYISVESQTLEPAVRSMIELGFRGFGVSMPFKLDIMPFLHEISADVASIGACNTVVNNNGRLTGHNTDWRGAMDALREEGIQRPGRALIMGAGGAARALIFGLQQAGWHVEIVARNLAAAKAVTADFSLPAPHGLDDPLFPGFNLFLNSTPVTDFPQDFLATDRLPDLEAVFDVVYNPVPTPLGDIAARRGLIFVPGWKMLLHQAMHQFTLYTNCEAPESAMRKALMRVLE